MRHREGRSLHEYRFEARLENVEADDEQNMVEPQRNDVREAKLEVCSKNLGAGELAQVRIEDVRGGRQGQQHQQRQRHHGAAAQAHSSQRFDEFHLSGQPIASYLLLPPQR